jgi:hypothetical protein
MHTHFQWFEINMAFPTQEFNVFLWAFPAATEPAGREKRSQPAGTTERTSRQIFGKNLVIVHTNAGNHRGLPTIAGLATKTDKPLRARLSGA